MQFFTPLLTPLIQRLPYFNVPSTDESISAIIKGFLEDHEMMSTSYPSVCTTNEELEAYMHEELKARNYPIHMEKTVHLAASLVEVGTS
ncbi:hypothetical protein DXG01_012032 [Tephrocybe rancida]|nr:hypothetical protein DXG01_012032 [Tephrocybe rancida]